MLGYAILTICGTSNANAQSTNNKMRLNQYHLDGDDVSIAHDAEQNHIRNTPMSLPKTGCERPDEASRQGTLNKIEEWKNKPK
jgi:hypothetical protein